jgi:nitrogen regulatory protein P-II 1
VKLITAVVKPDKLDHVIRAVAGAGARGLTVTEVHGFGQQYGHMAPARSGDQNAFVLPKLRIEVLVQDESAGPVADAIAKSVNTGAIGDGKIWVSPVDSALRYAPASAIAMRSERQDPRLDEAGCPPPAITQADTPRPL